MNVLLSLLLLLAPPPIKVEKGRFNIIKDGRKIGTDEFAVTMTGSKYTVEGKATIGDVSISSKMDLDEKLIPTSYEVSSPEGKLQVVVASPISEFKTVVKGQTSSADFRFPEKGVILDNNLFHHYLILMYRAHMGQMEFPVVVPQDMSLGVATVRMTSPRNYDLLVGDVKMQATTDENGGLIRLTVPGAKVTVER